MRGLDRAMQLGRLDPGCACPLLWLGRSALSVCQREGRGGILFGGLSLSCSSDLVLSFSLGLNRRILGWLLLGVFPGRTTPLDGWKGVLSLQPSPCCQRTFQRTFPGGCAGVEKAFFWEKSFLFLSLSLSARRSWPFRFQLLSSSPLQSSLQKADAFFFCRKESSHFAQPFLLGG